MKKKVLSILLACSMVLAMAACGGNSGDNSQSSNTGSTTTDTTTTVDTPAVTDDGGAAEQTGELVDGKFAETRKITVEIYDRGNDGGSDPENNKFTDYIKQGMLDQHNVEVTFKKVPRWTETDDINNLLAAGTAPDICVTYSYPTILTYANMGGVVDMAPLVEEYKSELPNLWNWLGETNIYWDKDPKNGTLWAVEGVKYDRNRVVTFVRQDWLDALSLSAPTTTQEFEDMLIAFRDNASTLLGADASKMIPYAVSYDVGWRAATLIESFIDPDISDKDFYIYGFDDRKLTEPGTKEAVRLLNKWYNDGLMWDDFALYGSGDTTEDDMMKSGYVGAFTHNWDYPFRNAEDSVNANLARLVGEDAKFVAIDPFTDSKGGHTKYVTSSAGDRKIFFPSTNSEPLASMLYLDFISSPEVIKYLQIGDEGVNHEVLDGGAIKLISASGNDIMNSGNNIDYTITCNGQFYGSDELGALSKAYSYAEIDPALVAEADRIAQVDAVPAKNVNVGEIAAEAGVGETLSAKRDQVYDLAVVAPVDQFDATWDAAMSDYLSAGGQAIIDERTQKWEEFFGSSDMLP